MSVLKECCGFMLLRHIVVKIYCNRAVEFNIYFNRLSLLH